MPSFLIVHSQPPGGRADLFAQPPTIDVAGLGARLDWGDVTFEVPPGDHRVAISVAPVVGGREGAVVTVRVLPETGTRISFSPPAAPGLASTLHVDGQWPADAAMAYYAARDRRDLTPIAQQLGGPTPGGQWGAPQPQAQPRVPQPQAGTTQPAQPSPSVPPVGPTIGSTGSVPIVAPPSSAPSFGQMQGAVVEPGAQQPHPPAAPPLAPAPGWSAPQPRSFAPPGQVAPPPMQQGHPSTQHAPPWQPSQQQQPVAPQPPQRLAPPQQPAQGAQRHPAAPHAFGPGAPQHQPPQQGAQQPAFGHQPIVRRDVYGRDRVDGDRSAPAIPTPREFESFARAERERHEAEAVAATRQQQGWYADPYGRSDVRWHDGERWTPSVMRQGRREHDPV